MPTQNTLFTPIAQFWLRCLGALVGINTIVLTIMPARAADRIKFSYPPFGEFTISVKDLEVFADSGTITTDFSFYTQQATPEQLETLRDLLRRQFAISPVTMSQVTYSETGGILLDRLGQIVRTEANQNGSTALRAAFILSSAEPGGLNVVDVLRKFPSRDIRLDLPASLELARGAADIFQRRDRILLAIQQQTGLPPEPPADLADFAQLQQLGSITSELQSFSIVNPERKLGVPVTVYLPNLRQAPLVIISHGVASDRTTFAYLAQHLASYGFAVAVLEHPETSSEAFRRFLGGLQGSPDATDIIERPLDLKYLLDELERRSQSDPAWKNRINLDQVGMIGQSFGAYTALAAGGATIAQSQLAGELQQRCKTQALDFNLSMLLQCRGTELPVQTYDLHDARIKAIIAINPIGSVWFGQQGLAKITIPTMMIAGTRDYFAPPVPEQLFPFSWLTTPDRYLIIMDKGTHFSFLGDMKDEVFTVPSGLIGPDPALARPYLEAISVAFFRAYLANDARYRSYLDDAYVSNIATTPLTMTLITSLTEKELVDAQVKDVNQVLFTPSPIPWLREFPITPRPTPKDGGPW